MDKLTQNYNSGVFFDELIDATGKARAPAQQLLEYLDNLPTEELEKRRITAEARSMLPSSVYTVKLMPIS